MEQALTKEDLKVWVPEHLRPQVDKLLADIAEAGRRLGAAENSWVALFNGLRKSWTAWLATAVATWPLIESQVSEHLVKLLPQPVVDNWMTILGLAFLLLRMKTTESLEEKGMK